MIPSVEAMLEDFLAWIATQGMFVTKDQAHEFVQKLRELLEKATQR